MNESIWLIIFGVLILASFATGIVFLVKYFKTKTKKYLWFGLTLTFFIPGILIYTYFKIIYEPAMIMCYDVVALPPNETLSASFLLYRKDLLRKFNGRLSKNVIKKISEKKD